MSQYGNHLIGNVDMLDRLTLPDPCRFIAVGGARN